jgi:hypothetical protein
MDAVESEACQRNQVVEALLHVILKHRSKANHVDFPDVSPKSGVRTSYDVRYEALRALPAVKSDKSSASSLLSLDQQRKRFDNAENNTLYQCRVQLSEDLGI